MGKHRQAAIAKRRRRYTTTREQDALVGREASRRGVPEHVVFREVVDAGFEARFSGSCAASPDDVLEGLESLRREVEATRRSVRAGTKAELARAAWASYAAFNMMRTALGALGVDPDDGRFPSRAMSRFMGTTDCNVPTGIWESAGRRMADGDSYHDALVAACREHGVAWEEFSGHAPGRDREPEQAPKRKGGRGDGGGKRHGGKR